MRINYPKFGEVWANSAKTHFYLNFAFPKYAYQWKLPDFKTWKNYEKYVTRIMSGKKIMEYSDTWQWQFNLIFSTT